MCLIKKALVPMVSMGAISLKMLSCESGDEDNIASLYRNAYHGLGKIQDWWWRFESVVNAPYDLTLPPTRFRQRLCTMRAFAPDEPLTDAELDRLEEFLRRCKGGGAMNIEGVDGFFAALIAGPEVVLPSEYLTEVFGGEMADTCEFDNLDEANEILGFLMRHWNAIAATLHKDEVYVPLLLEDEDGVQHGNDWARGFMRGVEFSHEAWGELISDEKHGG